MHKFVQPRGTVTVRQGSEAAAMSTVAASRNRWGIAAGACSPIAAAFVAAPYEGAADNPRSALSRRNSRGSTSAQDSPIASRNNLASLRRFISLMGRLEGGVLWYSTSLM